MKVVALSDTHGMHKKLKVPDGDVLVIAGDILNRGTQKEMISFCEWLVELTHVHKVVVAGNHDWLVQQEEELSRQYIKDAGGIYLQDEGVLIDDILFYGSPWTPTFHNWSFMKDRGAEIQEEWDKIPEDTDVLITHGPPASILDSVGSEGPQGCADLLKAVRRVKPKYHIFGHIHEHGGRQQEYSGTSFMNVSVLDSKYHLNHKPMEFTI